MRAGGGGEAEMGHTAPRRRSVPAEPGSVPPGRRFRFPAPEAPAAAELRVGLGGEAREAAQPDGPAAGEKIPILGNINPNPPSAGWGGTKKNKKE